MVYQAHTVETDETSEAPLRSVARNTSEFAEDVLTLAELQAKLLVLEGKGWAQSQLRPCVMAICGGIVALGALPIAFLALAASLVEYGGLSPAQSLAIAWGLGVALSAGLIMAAYQSFPLKTKPFERSSREWDANFRWIRNMVRRQGRRW